MNSVRIPDLVKLMAELDKYKKTELNYYITFVGFNGGYEFRAYDKGKPVGAIELWDFGTEDEVYNAIIKEFDRCESLYRSKLHKILE